MKKLCATILFLPLFCGSVWATSSVNLEMGLANGKATFSNASDFDHDTSGIGWSVGYQKVLDSGLLFGGGYQSFEVSGSKTFQGLKVKTDKFSVSGIYGAVGYSLGFTKNLFFQPNLRLGIANKLKITVSNIPISEDNTNFGVVLPLVYQLGSLNLGGQIQLNNSNLVIKTEGSETKLTVATAYQFLVGFSF